MGLAGFCDHDECRSAFFISRVIINGQGSFYVMSAAFSGEAYKKGNTPSCFEGHVLSFQVTVSSLQEMSSAHAAAQSFQLFHRAAPW